MGYHVELVASPPRKIAWAELSSAARATGWQVSDADQDICLMRDGQLLARLNHADGEAWVKSPDDEVLSALIDLAQQMDLRVRGDDRESYRSLTDWYIHPDDAKDHAKDAARVPGQQGRTRTWDRFRIAVLILLIPLLAFKVYMDNQ